MGSGTKVVPFHVKALTLMALCVRSVSNETRKSPAVRLGICEQPGLAGLIAGLNWLNS